LDGGNQEWRGSRTRSAEYFADGARQYQWRVREVDERLERRTSHGDVAELSKGAPARCRGRWARRHLTREILDRGPAGYWTGNLRHRTRSRRELFACPPSRRSQPGSPLTASFAAGPAGRRSYWSAGAGAATRHRTTGCQAGVPRSFPVRWRARLSRGRYRSNRNSLDPCTPAPPH